MSGKEYTDEEMEQAQNVVNLVDPIADTVCAAIRAGTAQISELPVPDPALGPGLFSYLMNLQSQIEITYDAVLRNGVDDDDWQTVVAQFRADHPEAFEGEATH